ncbi:hypothetical protein ARMSODRAFT_450126 [Armillaria solidipes]|uniref:Metallo-beta-lactamase domain-containing protein n=1 Tax=Armillaria solidipes TaxID=1076256 RepID=A0A2H3BMC9_9AGAR|nr:hypothetical protein ARMSODRAFT_450126 [Armillaria solidipes]
MNHPLSCALTFVRIDEERDILDSSGGWSVVAQWNLMHMAVYRSCNGRISLSSSRLPLSSQLLMISSNATLHIADLPALTTLVMEASTYLHHPGHISGLRRVTPTTFVLLWGDCCYHVGDVRPTPPHYSLYPPASLLQSATHSLSIIHFPKLASGPLLKIPPRPPAPLVYKDYEATMRSPERLAWLDADPTVLMVIAHDRTAPGVVEQLPRTVNSWKEKGWKDKLM